MIDNIAVVNGAIVSNAAIPVDDVAYQYGFGVYESLKVRKKQLFFVDEHVERLMHSAAVIGLEHSFSADEIRRDLDLLYSKITEESYNIKIIVVGGKTPTRYVFGLKPKFLPASSYTQGVSAVLFDGQRQFVQAKTLNMLQSYLAFSHAKKHDAFDAFMVHADGSIVEGSRANLFFTDGKTIFTAPDDVVLAGVTRKHVIAEIKRAQIPFEYKVLNKKDISTYKGFFFTSTSAKVVPVSSIDGKKIDIPDIVRDVLRVYKNVE